MTTERLTARDYQDALDVQNACNLSGVVFSFAKVMEKICEEARLQGKGTEWKNNHPIAVMFASKIASLTRSENPLVLAEADNAATRLSKEEPNKEEPI